MRDKAYRRSHKERLKLKCWRIQKRRHWINDPHCKTADNLAVCSCPSCGNPRKWWHVDTLAEYNARVDFHEQYESYPKPRPYRR